MDIGKLSEEIRKTGFVLENNIAMVLKRNGWTVISNKYYEDDFEGSVREIDLLAYKVSKVQDFDLYTTILISCKKSESNVWALLARDINIKDPNSDLWPLHVWTNKKPLIYQISRPGMSRVYHDDVNSFGVKGVLSVPDVDVFAFQEMSRGNGAPKNDKNIFNAVTSLMKAQSYELSSLPLRKKSPAVYQFNLLSIIDSDLVRLKFSGDEISGESVDTEHYIARYIIKKKEAFSRVRFIRASYFEDALPEYNRLHEANRSWFDKEINRFFDGAVEDYRRVEVLIDEFRSMLKWTFLYRLDRRFQQISMNDLISLDWRKKDGRLAVLLSASSEVLEFLNNDDESKKVVSDALKKVYRYSGEFFFDDDILF